ncbi:hypothetical protein [Hydrogenimonas sp.]
METDFIRRVARLAIGGMLCLSLYAEEGGEAGTDLNDTMVDDFHGFVSDRVLEWSDALDRGLVKILGTEEDEDTFEKEGGEKPLEIERKKSDTFFQTRKYLNETARTYIRMRLDTSVQSLEKEETNFHVRLHLPLPRASRRLRLFIEDLNEENAENLVKKSDTESGEGAPKVGINYFAPEAFGVHSKYSLGLSGLHPYVRARYNMVFEPGAWVIEPVQIFQYSEEYDFSESTNLYFDTEPWEDTLFRIRLGRGTQAHRKGMPYDLSFNCSWGLTGRSGMRVSQSFAGHTRYEYTPEGSDETEKYSGIYNYTTAFGYRRSIWRKWLYVEAVPSVNFHKEHDYHPNYSFLLLFDLFFGKYR